MKIVVIHFIAECNQLCAYKFVSPRSREEFVQVKNLDHRGVGIAGAAFLSDPSFAAPSGSPASVTTRQNNLELFPKILVQPRV